MFGRRRKGPAGTLHIKILILVQSKRSGTMVRDVSIPETLVISINEKGVFNERVGAVLESHR